MEPGPIPTLTASAPASIRPLWRLGCGVAAAANVSALDLRVILIQE